jgi:hypothetical protein
MPPSTRKGKRAAQAADVEAKKLKKLEETNKKLMAELASTKSGCNKVKRREANMNDAMKKEIDDTISLHIWPKIKFIRDDLQKEKLAIKVWNAMADNPKKNSESDRAIFISKYATYIVQELNGKRTYKMQRMGSAVMRLLGIGPNRGAEDAEDDEDDGDGGDNMYINDLPTQEEMLKCLKRDIKTDDERLMAVFMWYWDVYLPLSTGSRHQFNPSQRRYATISTCAPQNKPNKPFITPETEAYAVLCFENSYERCLRTSQLKAKFPGKKIVPAKKKKDGTIPQEDDYELRGEKCYSFGPSSKGKWTLADAGQSEFGGWHSDGLDRYNELRLLAKNARQHPNCKVVEEESLAQLRQHLQITAPNHDAHLAQGRAQRVIPDELPDTWDDSDTGDEEDDPEENSSGHEEGDGNEENNL